MLSQRLDQNTLQALVSAGVVREAIICRASVSTSAWCIQVKYGLTTQTLRSKREPVRCFHTVDTAAHLLHRSGLMQMTVDFG